MTLGEKIRKLRKQKKLSQEALANEAGINSNHLSRLERGVFQPSIEVLKKLALTLEVNVDSLLSDEDEDRPEVSIQNKELSERIRLIDQLDPEDQQAIMRVIDSMLTKHRMQKLLSGNNAGPQA
jgi:transcriptional regulator with XRE-family HTH domain